MDHQDVGEPQHHRGAARPRVQRLACPSRRASAAAGAPRRPRSARMCSTSGISADQRMRGRILEAHAAAREHRARAVAAVAQQHRPSADRLVGQLVDVAAGARPGALDTECATPGATRHEVARDQPRRLVPGRSSQASPSATKWKTAWSSAGRPEPPGRRQLAVAVEALDQPQIAQHLGQRIVRLGPGRLVAARLARRLSPGLTSDDRLCICDILAWTVRPPGVELCLVATHWERGAARFTTRERHMATIAVMGASGNIGGRITEQLLAGGHTVRAIGRSAEKLAGAKGARGGGPARRRRRRGVSDQGVHGRGRRVHDAAAQPRRARRSAPDMDRVGTAIAEAIAKSGVAPRGRDQQRRRRPAVRHRPDRRAARAGGAAEAPDRHQRAGAAPRLLLRELPPLARPDPSPGHQRRRRRRDDDPADDRDAGHRGLRGAGARRARLDAASRCGSCSARAT